MSAHTRTPLIGINMEDSAGVDVITGGLVAVLEADGTAVSTTTTETALASYVFAPGQLQNGSVIKIRAMMQIPGTPNSGTIDVRLRLGASATPGSNTAIAAAAQVTAAALDTVVFDTYIQVRDADSSGTLLVCSILSSEPEAAAAVANAAKMQRAKMTTVDFTAKLYLDFTAKWSVSHADNSCIAEVFIVEIL